MDDKHKGPLIVGFGHRRRVGKDALADLVWRRLIRMGVKPARNAFARKLKKEAFRLFGYGGLLEAPHYDNTPELREKVLPALGMSPRDLWIAVGNKLREVAPDVWIRAVVDSPADRNADILIVTDVRYPNEVDAIHERGGLVVKVTRSAIPEAADVADSALAGMPDADWDLVVANDGDLDALAVHAERVADFVLERMTARHMAGRKPPNRMSIAVDFDGILCRADWPRIGEAMPGAAVFLHWLKDQGIQAVLWTARNGHLLDNALSWLAARGFPRTWWSAINDSPEDVKRYYGEEGRKPGVDCFVDDRNACFPVLADDSGVPDWPRIQADIARRLAVFNAARARPSPPSFTRQENAHEDQIPPAVESR